MHTERSAQQGTDGYRASILVMADWALDPDTVAATVRRHQRPEQGSVGLVVPASLHGIDWAGDPTASIPCAERQLQRLVHRFRAASLRVDLASVGDPDPVAAAWDALEDWSADEILLFPPKRRLRAPSPLRVERRIERATGLSVSRLVVSASRRTRRDWLRPGGHCASPQPQPA